MLFARVYALITFMFAAVVAGFYFTGSVTDESAMLLGLSVVALLVVYTLAAYAVAHISEGGSGHRRGHPIR